MKRLIGMLIFDAVCCALIVAAGGGVAFTRRPVDAAYVALWAVWWLAIAVGRQRGAPSRYDRSQRGVMALGVVALVGLIVVPPQEYARWSGPLPRDGALAWLGLGLFAGGVALQVAALRRLRGLYTSRLGIQQEHRLVTGGPYRLVRHPGYASNLACLFGVGLAMSSLAGLCLALSTVPMIVYRIRHEEAMLEEAFGEAYVAYRRRTRWRLVPLIY